MVSGLWLALLASVLLPASGGIVNVLGGAVDQLLTGAGIGCSHENPILFSTDYREDQVRAYDVEKGESLGAVLPVHAKTGTTGIRGPNGILIYKDLLFVANQNIDKPVNGAVLAFKLPKTAKAGKLTAADLPFKRAAQDPVPETAEIGPVIPRGIAVGGPQSLLYIADAAGAVMAFQADPPYKHIGNVDTTGLPYAIGGESPYAVTGVVFGPDGLLYVGMRSFADPLFGAVLRFDVSEAPGVFKDIFANNSGDGCAEFLHRCEGMTWGPDDRLYVSAFAANKDSLDTAAEDPTNSDKVLIFSKDGVCQDYIEFDTSDDLANGERKDCNMPIFGPGSQLFTPLVGAGSPGPYGEIRAYNTLKLILDKGEEYRTSIEADGVSAPFYSAFAHSDPGTFAYSCSALANEM